MEWSDRLVRRARLAVQGTIDAAVAALRSNSHLAANLAGGTHHAMFDAGEGYCTLNDVAVAARLVQRDFGVGRILVIDLDVHHGNGTSSIFTGDPSVYTFSMHGEKNFPLKKPPSSCDVALPDGISDSAYLERLAEYLPLVIERAQAELVFYLAGVDVAKGDRFGRLALSEHGIALRDRMVVQEVAGRRVPLCLTLSGGYATGDDGRTSSERTAALHAIAHREVAAFLARRLLAHQREMPEALVCCAAARLSTSDAYPARRATRERSSMTAREKSALAMAISAFFRCRARRRSSATAATSCGLSDMGEPHVSDSSSRASRTSSMKSSLESAGFWLAWRWERSMVELLSSTVGIPRGVGERMRRKNAQIARDRRCTTRTTRTPRTNVATVTARRLAWAQARRGAFRFFGHSLGSECRRSCGRGRAGIVGRSSNPRLQGDRHARSHPALV